MSNEISEKPFAGKLYQFNMYAKPREGKSVMANYLLNAQLVDGDELLNKLAINAQTIANADDIYIIDVSSRTDNIVEICRAQLPDEKKHLVVGLDFKNGV